MSVQVTVNDDIKYCSTSGNEVRDFRPVSHCIFKTVHDRT